MKKRFKSNDEAALYLWDYFYLANYPSDKEKEPWRLIENATHRIRESVRALEHPHPVYDRLKEIKRVKRAVRVIYKQIPRLETQLDHWIFDVLNKLERDCNRVINEVTTTKVSPDLN